MFSAGTRGVVDFGRSGQLACVVVGSTPATVIVRDENGLEVRATRNRHGELKIGRWATVRLTH